MGGLLRAQKMGAASLGGGMGSRGGCLGNRRQGGGEGESARHRPQEYKHLPGRRGPHHQGREKVGAGGDQGKLPPGGAEPWLLFPLPDAARRGGRGQDRRQVRERGPDRYLPQVRKKLNPRPSRSRRRKPEGPPVRRPAWAPV